MATTKVTIRMDEETMQAIKDVERLRKDPNKRTYSSFDELLKEVEADV